MEARCPRCSTVFTTDRSGIQFCPNCGQQVDVPDPYARPPTPETWGQPPAAGAGGAGGAPPPGGFGSGRFTGEPPPGGTVPGGRELTPWERRKELGVVQGFIETWKRSVLTPQTFFPTVRPDVPWTEALYYAWILHAFTAALGVPFLALGMFRPTFPSGFGGDAQVENAMRAFSGGFGLAWLAGSLLVYPLGVLIGAAIVHLSAMIFGAAQNGYGATVRALCYASGPNPLSLVPCFGVLASVYTIVLAIFAMSGLQQTTMGKAAGIVLLPFVVLMCCCFFAFSAIIAAITGLAGSMSGGTRSL